MEELRNWLLKNQEIELYEEIVRYMESPTEIDSQTIEDKAPTEIAETLSRELNEIIRLYASDRDQYQSTYLFGQAIIWNEILTTYKNLSLQKKL